jgi:hypothetical protein
MIKRFNFTGRKRVPRKRVAIEVYDGKPRTFAAAIDLDGMGFLNSAEVKLEATCAGSNVVKRFDFGTVEKIVPPAGSQLEDLEGENVFFSLKVIDKSERFGRILGIAENIRPVHAGKQTATGRRGILPVEHAELGNELWRLDFKENDVFLLVNRNVSGVSERFGYDPLFFAVLYPNIIRTILHRAIEEQPDVDAQDDRWPVLWLNFGRKLQSEHAYPPPPDESEACDEWVEDVVSQFCNLYRLKAKYAEAGSFGDWSGES